MKRIRYSKYVPDPAGEMSLEDLLNALSDYLLQSGFQDSMWYEMPEGEQTLDQLKRAIEQALLNGDLFDENLREQIERMQMEGQLDECELTLKDLHSIQKSFIAILIGIFHQRIEYPERTEDDGAHKEFPRLVEAGPKASKKHSR